MICIILARVTYPNRARSSLVSQRHVRAAVRFSVDQDVYPAIRGGGHNAAGLAMVDGGLVVDLSRMKGIFIDPANSTVTAQMGLTWGEFDRETHVHGLATTGGLISTTGIAGLTLGGGVGWLMGRCGLVCDNTLSYDVVVASGELIRASAGEHADLFWALKGGGGNFGVVTSIAYRVYPISAVISGMVLHPLAHAREVLRFYRDFVMSGLPAAVATVEGQTSRAHPELQAQPTDLAKNVFMAGLRDSNEVRFTGCWSTVRISPSPSLRTQNAIVLLCCGVSHSALQLGRA